MPASGGEEHDGVTFARSDSCLGTAPSGPAANQRGGADADTEAFSKQRNFSVAGSQVCELVSGALTTKIEEPIQTLPLRTGHLYVSCGHE